MECVIDFKAQNINKYIKSLTRKISCFEITFIILFNLYILYALARPMKESYFNNFKTWVFLNYIRVTIV